MQRKELLENIRKRAAEQLRKNKYLLALIVLGTVLLLWPKRERSAEAPAATVQTSAEIQFSLEEQEQRLAGILSAIEGAGETRVMLTLKTSTEQILARDTAAENTRRNGETEEENTVTTVVITAGSGLQSTVTLKYVYPEYQGAVVVSEGADSAAVRLELTQAVAAVTGLSSDKISVLRMQDRGVESNQ